MLDVDRMVKRAEQLERLADEVFSFDHKRELLQIAGEWREIAARVQRARTSDVQVRPEARPN